jgi:hypothetical protein
MGIPIVNIVTPDAMVSLFCLINPEINNHDAPHIAPSMPSPKANFAQKGKDSIFNQ